MPNQNGSGRHTTFTEENRPSWRPQDQNERTADDRGTGHADRVRDEEWRSIERGGQGQSGYMAGQRDDRSTGVMGRNTDYGRSFDERDRDIGGDDRFYGRGGSPRFEEDQRVHHPGYRGGSSFGRMDTGYSDRGIGTYGPRQDFTSRHGGYGPMDQGNYGQSGRQDSFGQGDFGQRGTPNVGMRGGHRGKGPKSFVRSDERIKERVSELLTDHDDIDASNIEVAVKNGEVTLTGTVDDRYQRRMMEDLVEGISGVRDVHMSIKLHNPSGHKPATSSTVPDLENSNDTKRGRA